LVFEQTKEQAHLPLLEKMRCNFGSSTTAAEAEDAGSGFLPLLLIR